MDRKNADYLKSVNTGELINILRKSGIVPKNVRDIRFVFAENLIYVNCIKMVSGQKQRTSFYINDYEAPLHSGKNEKYRKVMCKVFGLKGYDVNYDRYFFKINEKIV